MKALVNEELKPCPFCGGDVSLKDRHQGWDNMTAYYVTCKCGLAQSKGYEKSKVIAAWNLRKGEQK